MADIKQATTVAVCEHCGLEILDKFDGLNGSHWRTKSTGGFCIKSADGHVPRTQPSQTELRIPDDLTDAYANEIGKEWASFAVTGRRTPTFVRELIERIARLEGGR